MNAEEVTVVKLQALYETNQSFRTYIDKYCEEVGCDVEEALTHTIVQWVYQFLYSEEAL